MTVSIITQFHKGENSLNNLIENEIEFQKGFFAVNFSEMLSNSKPDIKTESLIEVNGDLYIFNDDLTPSGTPSTGVCYVKVYLSGSDLLADFTNTDPAYDSSRRGYYGSSATADHRYILKLYYDGSNYKLKQIMKKERFWNYEI